MEVYSMWIYKKKLIFVIYPSLMLLGELVNKLLLD